jgi:hypothetical protein
MVLSRQDNLFRLRAALWRRVDVYGVPKDWEIEARLDRRYCSTLSPASTATHIAGKQLIEGVSSARG